MCVCECVSECGCVNVCGTLKEVTANLERFSTYGPSVLCSLSFRACLPLQEGGSNGGRFCNEVDSYPLGQRRSLTFSQ